MSEDGGLERWKVCRSSVRVWASMTHESLALHLPSDSNLIKSEDYCRGRSFADRLQPAYLQNFVVPLEPNLRMISMSVTFGEPKFNPLISAVLV